MKLDTSKQPMIPEGWSIESHKSLGKIDPLKLNLYLSKKQKTGYTTGGDLRKELEDKPVLNATVLDYLLKHPKLIPEDWKGKYVYFWGTIYRDSDGSLYVRFLYWDVGVWDWYYFWLDFVWHSNFPAAVSASSLPIDSLDSLKVRVLSLEKDMEALKKIIKI
jgi:hypothetical protein